MARMIRNTVRARFREVRCCLGDLPNTPIIFTLNHNGWHDGYVMYLVLKRLGIEGVDWIQEFDSFPLFRYVGGMPFPKENPLVRANTMRKSIRLLRESEKALVLFPEGVLHAGPGVLELGQALALMCKKVPEATLVSISISYPMGIHERPTAYILMGEMQSASEYESESWRRTMEGELSRLTALIAERPEAFDLLFSGTKDVNERYDLRKKSV